MIYILGTYILRIFIALIDTPFMYLSKYFYQENDKIFMEDKISIKKIKQELEKLNTPHGKINTPAFIFCATKGALKSSTTITAKENNTQIILSNTYHLMLQPGSDLIANHGGLHRFLNWNGPMLTDSGGFQIFSLGHGSVADEIKGSSNIKRNKTLLSISEEGVYSNHILMDHLNFYHQRNQLKFKEILELI